MKMKQCEIGSVKLLNQNVILVKIDNDKEIGIEHIFEFKNVALELTQNQKVYSIINYGEFSFPTKEARETWGVEISNNKTLGRALVVHDLGQLILTKHSIRQQKSNVPTRVFNNQRDAEKWVSCLVSNNVDCAMIG